MDKTRLVKITIIKTADGFWEVTRERKENGERATLCTLEDCFEYIRIHLKGESGEGE